MKVTAVTPFLLDPGYEKNWLFVNASQIRRIRGSAA